METLKDSLKTVWNAKGWILLWYVVNAFIVVFMGRGFGMHTVIIGIITAIIIATLANKKKGEPRKNMFS